MRKPFLVALSLTASMSSLAVAQTAWMNPAGGDANLATNWSAGLPTSGTNAAFSLPGPYAVSFSAALAAATVDVGAGEVALDLARQVFSASNINIGGPAASPTVPAALVARGGRLSVSSTLSVGRSPSTIGTLTVVDGGIVDANQLRVENLGRVYVGGAGSSLSFNFLSAPTGSSLYSSRLTVEDGGVVNYGTTSSGTPIGLIEVRGIGSRIRGVPAQTLRAESGAVVELASSTSLGSSDYSLTDSTLSVGSITIGSPSVGLPSGRLTLRNSVMTQQSVSQTLRVYPNTTFEWSGALVQALTTLTNDGMLRGDGRMTGQLDNTSTGSVYVGAGQRMSFEGRNSGNTNRGVIEVDGGELSFSAAINSSTSGLILARDAKLRFGDGTSIYRYNGNGGSLTVTGGTRNTIYGDINLASGRITHTGNSSTLYVDDVINDSTIQTTAGSNATYLGSVSGGGTFSGGGTNIFEGDLRPGASPGVLTFGGDVYFGNASTLEIELGGVSASQYDRVRNTGGQFFGDLTLNVKRWNGFTPLPGMLFEDIVLSAQHDLAVSSVQVVNSTGLAGLAITPVWSVDGNEIQLAVSGTAGDATLDGAVDFDDLLKLAQHYDLSGLSWLEGDFTGDTKVNFDDLLLLAQHYGTSGLSGGLSRDDVSTLGSSFAAEFALARSLVPEPLAGSLLAVSLFLGRRR